MAKKNPVSETTDIVDATPAESGPAAAELPAPSAPAESGPDAELPAPAPAPSAPAESARSDSKLDRAKAMFPAGGTFNLPGNPNAFTVMGDPELLDGAVHIMCEKHTGHTGLICVESLL